MSAITFFEVLCFRGKEGEGFVVLRPLCDDEGFTVMRQRLPDFFRDVRHKRVQESLRCCSSSDEDTAGAVCALFVRAVHADLCKLDIPIAEIVPDEVIAC